MSLKNSEHHYGWLAVVLHWLVAAVVVGLFALGFWMVDLSYYDEWYRKGPDLHRSIGLILFAVVAFWLLWRLINTSPRPLASHKRWEVISAHVAHSLLYVLMFVAMVSGYLITTADGSSISVRSEEHTSELQSRPHLVCRLLLEKKKKFSRNLLDQYEEPLGPHRLNPAPDG